MSEALDPGSVGRVAKIPSMNIGIGIITFLVLGLFALAFVYASDKQRDGLVFFAAACAGAGTLAAAFYSARTLAFTAKAQQTADRRLFAQEQALLLKEEAVLKQRMFVTALQYGERWNHPSMTECRKMALAVVAKKRPCGSN